MSAELLLFTSSFQH